MVELCLIAPTIGVCFQDCRVCLLDVLLRCLYLGLRLIESLGIPGDLEPVG